MLIIAIAGILAAFYFLFIFPTQWLKIERIRHPLQINKKLLQISDMHVERLRIGPQKLLKVIEKEKPDLILFTGDFTKRKKSLPKLALYLKSIAICRIPAYAVLGNHDYQQPDVKKLIELLRWHNIYVLRNESVNVGDFVLIGIDDYDSGKSDIHKAYRTADPDKKKVIMTHDPNIVLDLKKKYDYLVSGHLHGKQFNLPFFFKWKDAGPLPAMGIYKGLHRNRYGTYYISKGIGQTGINARLFVRSEITIHEL
jgi:predicted MPP superfamily phosphohydrolase